jgi:hypothetical protein
MFDFDKRVKIVSWKTGQVIATVSAYRGLLLMSHSLRFDDEHATGNVRTLHIEDASLIPCSPRCPIVFEQ